MARLNDIERDRRTATAAAVLNRTAHQRLAEAEPFGATAVRHSFNLDGYLERKLHRQWRKRGS